MTAPDEFLAPIRHRIESKYYLTCQDAPRLLAALDGVLALHQPTTVYEIDPMNGTWVYGDDDERKVMTVLCSECTPDSVIQEVDECDYDGPNSVDVCWPCPTVAVVTTALEGQG